MAIESDSDRLLSDINVTPFVDVMLVLLIIFMVSAPMMTQGVDVSLPHAKAKALPSEQEQIIITVNRDRQIFINDAPTSAETLRETLLAIKEKKADQQVYFRADQDVSYGFAIQIMAEIKNAGIVKLGMVTEPQGAFGKSAEKTDQKAETGKQEKSAE